MASWASIAVTAVLSIILAYMFLVARFRKVGNLFRRRTRWWAFGPRGRWWAITVIMITGAVSTGIGIILAVASGHMAAIYFGLLVPIVLWFPKIPPDLRPSRGLLAPFTIPINRLYDTMGDDMEAWCDVRLRAAAAKTERIADAAQYYFWQVAARLKDKRALAELGDWKDSIVPKIEIVRLIRLETTQERLLEELRSHRATSQISRYKVDDQAYLARRLESDALNELNLLLASLYRLGYHRLPIFKSDLPEREPYQPPVSEPNELQPSYPIISEVAHSLKTPLAHLEGRLQILRGGVALADTKTGDTFKEMMTSVQICKVMLDAYRELTRVSDQVEPRATESLSGRLQDMHQVYIHESGKETKLKVDIPTSVPGYSNNFILAILLPLLQNAVEASPGTSISIASENDPNFVKFTIKNDVEQLNGVQQLIDTSRLGVRGQSSKPGHQGLGIAGVNRMISRYADASTSSGLIDNQFIFQVWLPRRESNHELRGNGRR